MNFRILFSVVFVSVLTLSCYKDEIDPPPYNQDPNIVPTMTIAQLVSAYNENYSKTGSQLFSIQQDIIVSGIVNGDDETGNWYKEITFQDATAGMSLKINQSNLYTDYPVGRKIYVKCKGLAMGMNSGMLQIGGYIDTFTDPKTPSLGYINSDILSTKVIKGSAGNPVIADTVAIYQLNDNYHYKLIAIKKSYFEDILVGEYWADGVNKADASRKLTECSGNTLEIRTSGFSALAYEKVPAGNGIVTGMYTIYKSSFGSTTKQLRLRKSKDLLFAPGECGGVVKKIEDIRAMYKGKADTMDELKITGIVISDRVNKNTYFTKMVIQEENGSGIQIKFNGSHNFDMGDKVTISIAGGILEEDKSYLQISNINTSAAKYISKGNVITPRVAQVKDISNNGEAWESTLVKVLAPTISGSATYSGNLNLSDASGNVVLRTDPLATFAGSAVKPSPTAVTGIVTQFSSTRQFQVRTLADIE